MLIICAKSLTQINVEEVKKEMLIIIVLMKKKDRKEQNIK